MMSKVKWETTARRQAQQLYVKEMSTAKQKYKELLDAINNLKKVLEEVD